MPIANSSPNCGDSFCTRSVGKFLLFVQGNAETQAELRVVLEQ